LVDGVAIPLLYVSAYQINAEIPAPLGGVENGSAEIQVVIQAVTQEASGSTMLPSFRAAVDSSIFGIFLNPDGSVAAINQDGTLNSASNPAKAGTIVGIWANGFSASVGPVDGAVASSANNWCAYCEVYLGSFSETVAYAGAAPGLIDGAMQINFMIPATLSSASPMQVEVNFNGFGPDGLLWVQ
jgi:uncharacterized protein (TIGR03437 family)